MDDQKILNEEENEKVSGGVNGIRVYTCYKCNSRFGSYGEYFAHMQWHEKQEQQQK